MKVKMMMVTLLMTIASAGFAQGGKTKGRMEEIREEKKKFISEWCKFTDSESEKFWKIHDEMDQKLHALRKESKQEMRSVKDKGIDNMSDADLRKAMDNSKASEQKMHDVRWEYNTKFIDAIGVRKTAKFFEGEKMFRKKLLERLRDAKGDKDHHDDDHD